MYAEVFLSYTGLSGCMPRCFSAILVWQDVCRGVSQLYWFVRMYMYAEVFLSYTGLSGCMPRYLCLFLSDDN